MSRNGWFNGHFVQIRDTCKYWSSLGSSYSLRACWEDIYSGLSIHRSVPQPLLLYGLTCVLVNLYILDLHWGLGWVFHLVLCCCLVGNTVQFCILLKSFPVSELLTHFRTTESATDGLHPDERWKCWALFGGNDATSSSDTIKARLLSQIYCQGTPLHPVDLPADVSGIRLIAFWRKLLLLSLNSETRGQREKERAFLYLQLLFSFLCVVVGEGETRGHLSAVLFKQRCHGNTSCLSLPLNVIS